MKKILTLVSLLILFFCTGCMNSKTANKNIGGIWESYYVLDKEMAATTDDVGYDLEIEQNGSLLKVILSIDQSGNIFSANLTGQISGDTFSLSSEGDEPQYIAEGKWENNDSIQINIVENFHADDDTVTVRHVLFRRMLLGISLPPTNRYELKNVCGKGHTKNIILIHGFNSTAGIWESMTNHFKDEVCHNYAVWTYQYDWKRHIVQSATDMVSRVNSDLTGEAPILIAHSMGGLVARSYIAQHGYFKRLITLSTPHEGASKVSRLINHLAYDGLSDLEPDSSFLTDLNANAFERSQRSKYLLLNGRIDHEWKCADICRTACIFSHCKTVCCHCCGGHFQWTGNYPTMIKLGYFQFITLHGVIPNDGVVSQDSARFLGDNHVHRVNENKFKWICHNSLPYNKRVIKFISEQIMD